MADKPKQSRKLKQSCTGSKQRRTNRLGRVAEEGGNEKADDHPANR